MHNIELDCLHHEMMQAQAGLILPHSAGIPTENENKHALKHSYTHLLNLSYKQFEMMHLLQWMQHFFNTK